MCLFFFLPCVNATFSLSGVSQHVTVNVLRRSSFVTFSRENFLVLRIRSTSLSLNILVTFQRLSKKFYYLSYFQKVSGKQVKMFRKTTNSLSWKICFDHMTCNTYYQLKVTEKLSKHVMQTQRAGYLKTFKRSLT